MTDLTAPKARGKRDQLASRVDVLDKVKVLSLLADDMNGTTDQVASFFEVPRETIRSLVMQNRDEIEDDGYRVITRAAFEESFQTKLPSSASKIALFPRRAILRVGMLLRDSSVARRVRDYLLVTESSMSGFDPAALSRLEILKMALAAEEEKAILEAALESAAPAIAYHDRHIAENDDVITVKTWGAQLGLTEPQAYALLRDKSIIYRLSFGERWSRSKGRKEEVFEYRARAGRVSFEWFEPRPQHNAPRHHNGQVKQTLYVKQFFADHLAAKCGLTAQLARGGDAA